MKSRFILSLSALGLILALSGCTDEPQASQTTAGIATDKEKTTQLRSEDVAAYLRFKRLDGADAEAREAAVKALNQRDALRRAIVAEKTLDETPLRAELDDLERQIWISNYFNQFLAEQVTDEKIEAYYRENEAKYQRTRAHVAHIFIRAPKRLSESERKVKLSKAHEALSMARAGRPFDELASAYSDDEATREKGGDLGWVNKGSLTSALDEVVFSSRKGLSDQIVDSDFGFHVVRVIHEPLTGLIPLAEVQSDIRYRLRSKLREAETARLLATVEVAQ